MTVHVHKLADLSFRHQQLLTNQSLYTTNLHTYPTLLIQQVQYPKFGLYQVDAWLVVIKIYEFPLYLFS